ncbi:hypothetical protein [Burkholderia phage BCSR5]|nr:hypothetical protein [Burkholderia phage BCSR5]
MADSTQLVADPAVGAPAVDPTVNPNQLIFSDLTTDFNDFKSQMESYLEKKPTWKGNLTIQTSTTLVDLDASIATFMSGRLLRAFEDVFAETAQGDDAIRSIAQMQGLRLTRYLPAQITATITMPADIDIAPLTQFNAGGQYFFNRTQLSLKKGINPNVPLYQGQVNTVIIDGDIPGTDLQTYVAEEDGFVISDQDVQVQLNDVTLPKALGGLWNYKKLPAYSDLTLADGRLLIQFGSQQFGSVPQPNDKVVIKYAVTTGANANNMTIIGREVTAGTISGLTGVVDINPKGGANDKDVIVYKNVASGSLGTYQSAVTKSQYTATVATYPGIVDAITQAQREINPRKLEWMNIIRVSGLTTTDTPSSTGIGVTSGWTQQQKRDFCDYMQTVTMYAPYFIWQDPIAIARDVDLTVYVFNSADPLQVQLAVEQAIIKLFSPRPGLLMTNFYPSDLDGTAKRAAPGMVSYVEVNNPTGPMLVTAPESPQITYTIIPGGGMLGEKVYAYSISTVVKRLLDPATGETYTEEGPPSNWVFPQVITTLPDRSIMLQWPPVQDAVEYHLWGRTGDNAGLLAKFPATQLSFEDKGTLQPDPSTVPPNTIAEVPIRYNFLRSLKVTVKYAERQQRLTLNDPTRKIVQ